MLMSPGHLIWKDELPQWPKEHFYRGVVLGQQLNIKAEGAVKLELDIFICWLNALQWRE